ncbi:hypothetical protein C6W27_22930, partial [Bacillus paralicheniformis]
MCIEKPSLTKGVKLSKEKPPLLQIELDDIDSVPRVFYKGKEIKRKIRVDFSFLTNDDTGFRPTHI